MGVTWEMAGPLSLHLDLEGKLRRWGPGPWGEAEVVGGAGPPETGGQGASTSVSRTVQEAGFPGGTLTTNHVTKSATEAEKPQQPETRCPGTAWGGPPPAHRASAGLLGAAEVRRLAESGVPSKALVTPL